MIYVYAPQIGLVDDIKREFWEELEDVMQSIAPQSAKLLLDGDFNGHIGTKIDGYDGRHGGFSYRERNSRRVSLMDFVVAYNW